MDTLGKRIKKAREDKNMLQSKLASLIGVKSAGVISNWENDKNKPDAECIVALCRVLNITPSYLLNYHGEDMLLSREYDLILSMSEKDIVKSLRRIKELDSERYDFIISFIKREKDYSENRATLISIVNEINADRDASIEAAIRQKVRCLSYYGKIAAAGLNPVGSFSDLMEGTVEVADTPESRKADGAIGVLGESMEPTFYDGDIVLIKKGSERLHVGEIGIFQKDNEVYIKEVGESSLISHNPKYPPIENNSDVFVLGKVIGKAEVVITDNGK